MQTCIKYLVAKEQYENFPHLYQEPPPFKLIIHGGPGTGKTRLAEAIVSRILHHGKNVSCAAPTGVAASLLYQGRTLHNLFALPTKRSQGIPTDTILEPLRLDQLTKGRLRFNDASLLIIDEMSMIDTTLLYHIHTRLQEFTGSEKDFGGIPIILMGDMFQLPPCPGEPMYKTVFKEFVTDSKIHPSHQGCELFTSFSYYELKEQMRSRDPQHTNLISAMRTNPDFKQVAPKLLKHLRVIHRDDIINDPSWIEAPIIVTSNYERYVLNIHKARAFALAKGVPVLMWKKPLVGHLATRLSTTTKEYLYDKRPELIGVFVQSAPCVLREENINPTRGLANGTQAVMHSIYIPDNCQPDSLRESIRNAQPGQIIYIPIPYSINVEIKFKDTEHQKRVNDWPNDLTLQDDSDGKQKAVVIPILSNIDMKGIKIKNTKIDFKDHFVDLAFSLTYHKIQGKTVNKIIIDINKRPGSQQRLNAIDFFGFYVGLSRVTDSNNMRIMPPHAWKDFAHISNLKCNPRLRRWMNGYNKDPNHWELIQEDEEEEN